MTSFVIASGPCALPGGARCIALSLWLFVMYMSRVSGGRGFVCAGGAMMKLPGFRGCVHGASGRCYSVALFVRVRSVWLLLI